MEEHVLSAALLEGHPEIYIVSNVVENGKAKGRAYAGTYWHSDMSYKPMPSMGSLMYVYRHAMDPTLVYRHQWRSNDLVFWDNRCSMHKAVRDYDAPRHMHRTTVRGDKPYLE